MDRLAPCDKGPLQVLDLADSVIVEKELPFMEPIETAPRVLKQAGLMGVPDEATVEPEIT